MPKVTIDGQSIEVPEGTSILQAARMIGGDIVPPAIILLAEKYIFKDLSLAPSPKGKRELVPANWGKPEAGKVLLNVPFVIKPLV